LQRAASNSRAASTEIARALCRIVAQAPERLTPRDLLDAAAVQVPAARGQVRAALKSLIAAGELTYTYFHGHSFVEPAFDRPVLICDRLILKPSNRRIASHRGEVAVSLLTGSAFGTGRHPTTRLALQGIAHILRNPIFRSTLGRSRVLDIGTGSGVLAIAALKLGIETGLALDIDPCARSEARSNVRLNDQQDRLLVCDRMVEKLEGAFQLVIANLRTPTLMRLSAHINRLTAHRGAAVITGLKTEESPALVARYLQHGLHPSWQKSQKRWCALVFQRPPAPSRNIRGNRRPTGPSLGAEAQYRRSDRAER